MSVDLRKEMIKFTGKIFIIFLSCICLPAFLPVLSAAVAQQAEFAIDSVEFVGNERIDKDALKTQLKYKSGSISSAQISEEVKSLYKTGFFSQVTASVVTTDSGSRVLRYLITEKPLVRKLFIKGNKEVSEDSLKEVLSLEGQRFLDDFKVSEMTQKATALYKKKGYFDVTFEHSVKAVGQNQVDLTFSVNEGPRYKIDQIKIEGLDQVDESDLTGLMQTKTYKWWSSWLFGTGRLDEEMLEADRGQIRQYLLDNGYVDGLVSEPAINKKDQEFDVVFRVKEGPQYNFGSINVKGDSLETGESVEEVVSAEKGETFSAKTIREDAFAVGDLYGDHGYAFANVVPDTAVKRNEKEVDVVYSISKGKQVHINKVNVKGNTKTYDNVIRRELRVDEGELYSGKKLRRTQEVLQRRGYFDEVGVTTESVADDKVDANVNVKEGQTGTFSAGAGYSTSDGLLFNTRIAENNIFGTGRKASLNLDFGTERDSYVLALEDPRLMDTHISSGITLSRTDRVFDDYDRQLTGPGISFGYPLEEVFDEWAQDLGVGVKYEYLDIDINDVDPGSAQLVLDSAGKSDASSVTPRIYRNTINNPLNPSKGSRQDASIELAGMGGQEDFYIYELKNTFYYPLVETFVGEITLSMRTNYAVGEAQGDSDYLPLYRRFYAGGINSVRGYDNRSITPKDANGKEYGGASEFVHNTDLLFPLVNSAGIKGLLFYDMGNAYDDNQSVDFADLKTSYGFGIRWNSPMGPLRLEFGFPLDTEQGENDGMKTHFSFGAPF